MLCHNFGSDLKPNCSIRTYYHPLLANFFQIVRTMENVIFLGKDLAETIEVRVCIEKISQQ